MRRLGRLGVAAVVMMASCTGGDEEERAPVQAPAPEKPLVPGVEMVELVAPGEEGGGEVPLFQWRPVEGAAAYRLIVLNEDGEPIWGWMGEQTSVRLGGVEEEPPEGDSTPVITPGSTWTVSALDARDNVIALSSRRSVSP